MRRFVRLLIVTAFAVSFLPALVLSSSEAAAQSYPSKKISWIVFGGKGGGGDRWSRILASHRGGILWTAVAGGKYHRRFGCCRVERNARSTCRRPHHFSRKPDDQYCRA